MAAANTEVNPPPTARTRSSSKSPRRAGETALTLTAYERGKEPMLPHLPAGEAGASGKRIPGKRIPAEPVNGRPAYWISKPAPAGQSSFELRWQYAPESWANLQAVGLRGSGARLTRAAYKIAESVTFGGTRQIAMPLHVDGVPGGLHPSRVMVGNGASGEVEAFLDFGIGGPSSQLGISVTRSTGAIGTAVPAEPGGPITGLPRPNTTLGGHPAYHTPRYALVYGVNGFDVRISATGSVLKELNKNGGIAGLFGRTTILGTDPANWTTNPVN